jgi:peptide/nickel transport system substrate-binding protein
VQFLSYSGNTGADAAILAGQLDWASNFIPNIKQTYVAASSANHLVEVPVATTFLITNDQRGPTASLAVRKAISEAINSSLINQVVYDGEYLPANPEAMMLPNYEAYLSPALQNAKLSYDPSQAEQTLQAAGYKKGPDGIYVAPDGAPLSLTAQVVSGYTDYISILQILTEELKAAGIQLNTQIESTSAFAAAQDNGNFQLLMSSSGYTPSVYAYYYALLDSAVSAPIGQAAAGDYGRFHSAQLNSLLTQIAATQSTAAQLPLFYQVEQLVASQFPDIPILEGASGTEFNGKVISGFPTADNNYAGPDSWMEPDSGWVADRLSPVGS